MNENGITLLEGEEVIFDSQSATLTNQRLLAHGRRKSAVNLTEIVSYQRVFGGEESHMKGGLYSLGVGAAIILFEIIVPGLPELLDIILFFAGSAGIVAGLYIAMKSLIRVMPHTSILFRDHNLDDHSVTFPGRDNPQAEELIRRFNRVKRGV